MGGVRTLGTDAFTHIVDDLAHRYSSSFTREEVQARVDAARAEIEPVTRHPEFLEVLVSKHARDHLLSAARASGRPSAPVPEILFVCVHNTARSQMAAAIAEHLSQGRVHVRSAGRELGQPLHPDVVAVLAEHGIPLEHPYPSGLSNDVVHAADVIVDMGCDLPEMAGRRTLAWDVADPHGAPVEQLRAVRDDLERRVRSLLVELGVPVRD